MSTLQRLEQALGKLRAPLREFDKAHAGQSERPQASRSDEPGFGGTNAPQVSDASSQGNSFKRIELPYPRKPAAAPVDTTKARLSEVVAKAKALQAKRKPKPESSGQYRLNF